MYKDSKKKYNKIKQKCLSACDGKLKLLVYFLFDLLLEI